MKFIDSNNKNILRTRRGGGIAMVFGIAFMFTGLIIISLSPSVPDSTPWYVPAIFGAVFLIAGIILTFGRNGIVLDRRKRSMSHWSGLMYPMIKKSYSLDHYDHICISKDLHHSDGRTHTVYPVTIKSRSDSLAAMIFHEPGDYIRARKDAEKISIFLNFPVIDTSSGEEVVRRAGSANKTLLEKEGSKPRVKLLAPRLMNSIISEKDGKLIIDIPPRKLSSQELKRMFFLLGMGVLSFIVIFGLDALKNFRADQLMIYLPVAVVILLFAVRPILWQSNKSWRVIISNDFLLVKVLGPGRKWSTRIPIKELEELLIGDPVSLGGDMLKVSPPKRQLAEKIQGPSKKAITANSDRKTVSFGRGLKDKELDYLRALIVAKICARG